MYACGKGRHTNMYCCVYKMYYSVTVQQNPIKLGVDTAPYSGSVSSSLEPCGSFTFGVQNVLVSTIQMYSKSKTSNAHNSSLEGAMRLKQGPLDFSFHVL